MQGPTSLSVVAFVLSAITASANLGDSPEQVAAAMKMEPSDVKQGLNRHLIEVSFTSDGNFALFTFLDGRVCRELYVKHGDAIQEDHLAALLSRGKEAGHQWNVMPTTAGNRRWRRDDDAVDIVYGSIKKSTIKNALVITAPEYAKHLEQIVATDGQDMPGVAPSVDEVKSRMRSKIRDLATAKSTIELTPKASLYQFGYASARYGIPLAIVGFVIRAWTRSVARRSAVPSGSSRAQYYRLLLSKMSWRVGLIFVGSMLVVILSQNSQELDAQQVTEAAALALILLVLFCPPAMLLTSWTQAKQKFTQISEGMARAPGVGNGAST